MRQPHTILTTASYTARRKPIPIGPHKRLSASGCIGNAPAISLALPPIIRRRRTPDTTLRTYRAEPVGDEHRSPLDGTVLEFAHD
jgi:hypothetical protein